MTGASLIVFGLAQVVQTELETDTFELYLCMAKTTAHSFLCPSSRFVTISVSVQPPENYIVQMNERSRLCFFIQAMAVSDYRKSIVLNN